MTGIDETLSQRGKQYGEFGTHAKITQAIKCAMVNSPNWGSLPDDMKESLEMVAHKVGRILNGDPNFHDSWHDIVGYVRLVEQRLNPPEPGPDWELANLANMSPVSATKEC